jgi:hypothetical protein
MAKKKVTETQQDSAVKMEKAAAAPKKRSPAAKHKPATKKTPAVKAAEPTVPAETAPAVEVTSEQIARLAYSFWEARGYAPGDPNQDWLRAERELHARAAAAANLATVQN